MRLLMSECLVVLFFFFFFFNDTATTEIYTLSLHDALPISRTCWAAARSRPSVVAARSTKSRCRRTSWSKTAMRSEEHTSELQSQSNLVCRLLLEKKKNTPEVTSRVQTRVSWEARDPSTCAS